MSEPFQSVHLASLIDKVEDKARADRDDDVLKLVRFVRVALVQSLLDRVEADTNSRRFMANRG